MNKYIKVCSIIVLMIFSFYYTEKIAIYVQNNTPLKKEIITYKNSNKIESINATIDGDYIIPGINGLLVNVNKSYNQMKIYNVFSEKYIVYDEVNPIISVNNFKDKIIKKGNPIRNAVSILVNNNSKSASYLKVNKIPFDYIDKTNYCIKLRNNNCNTKRKLIVEPTVILSDSNFINEVNKISKGYIIYIDENLSEEHLYILINQIKFNNLNIIKINNHLTENYQL